MFSGCPGFALLVYRIAIDALEVVDGKDGVGAFEGRGKRGGRVYIGVDRRRSSGY